MSDTVRRPGQPLLSITIPTFNRAPFLAQLLECLLAESAGLPPAEIEIVISDNCSEDTTPAVVSGFQQRGLVCRYIRNAENIGSDGNFLRCMENATGQYAWVLGDDDLIMPGGLRGLVTLLGRADYDLVYLSSFGFSGDFNPSNTTLGGVRGDLTDRLGRYAEVVTDRAYFLGKVNSLIGLISVNIINKNRLLATPHPPIDGLRNTNLIQLGWLFPLLHREVTVLYLWERILAYRCFNSGGWGACEVFGVRLPRIAMQYFADEPDLTRALLNGTLRYWMLNSIIDIRRGQHGSMNQEDFAATIQPIFSGNWRFWIFIYPVATLPLPLANLAFALLNRVNRAARITQALRRHLFGHGQYLRP